MSTDDQGKAGPSDERFVGAILQGCDRDKGFSARLRRADNPATEYQSWEVLGVLGVDLEHDDRRLPYVTVAAAIAKSKSTTNGQMTLGQAIAACYEDGRDSSQAKTRLRRLLACDELTEVCRILRPILSLIDSKAGKSLDYVRLLRQLRNFPFHAESIKAEWAQEFYRQTGAPEKESPA